MGEPAQRTLVILAGSRERLVRAQGFNRMLPLPTGTAVVLETLRIATEKGPGARVTNAAHGVLEIRIDLDAFLKSRRFDFDETRLNGFHETAMIAKRHATRA